MCLQKCLNVIRFASRPLCDVFTTPPPTILDSIVTLAVTLPSRRRGRKNVTQGLGAKGIAFGHF